jgi:hypothetical protein
MSIENRNTEGNDNHSDHPTKLQRIDGHYIMHEITHVLHFEKGILYTIRELSIRPGENVKRFISEDRSRLVKPIIFLIITSLIYSIISHFFHLEGYMVVKGFEKTAVLTIFNWIQNHYGYSNIIMGIFIALWIKVFFLKSPFNFFEILILLCFVMGMGMLIYSLFALIQGITHFNFMQFGGTVSTLYAAWAIGQFFDKKKVFSYFKAFIAYILGFLSFSIVAIVIGVVIDLMGKH